MKYIPLCLAAFSVLCSALSFFLMWWSKKLRTERPEIPYYVWDNKLLRAHKISRAVIKKHRWDIFVRNKELASYICISVAADIIANPEASPDDPIPPIC